MTMARMMPHAWLSPRKMRRLWLEHHSQARLSAADPEKRRGPISPNEPRRGPRGKLRAPVRAEVDHPGCLAHRPRAGLSIVFSTDAYQYIGAKAFDLPASGRQISL